MKILVTGAAGFVGKHLLPELLNHGHSVIGTVFGGEKLTLNHPKLESCALDIRNEEACREVFAKCQPDACIHLAGLAHTAETQNNLKLLFETNVAAAANVSRAMASCKAPSNRILLFVSSSFVYGNASAKLADGQCDELTTLSPRGAYGFSKLSAEAAVRMHESENFSVYIARPFNHIGPGQHSSFVVPGFASKIMMADDRTSINVGNLDATRDFTDVRDIVRGYRLLIETAPLERVFVFGSGKKIKIRTIFDELCKICNKALNPVVIPDSRRVDDHVELIANSYRLKEAIGWTPEIPLRTSLKDIVHDLSAPR
jgi:nucleoside-diphosphate-sugar epimerase